VIYVQVTQKHCYWINSGSRSSLPSLFKLFSNQPVQSQAGSSSIVPDCSFVSN